MKIAVMCAMKEEIRLLAAEMRDARSYESAGIVFTEGTLCGHDVLMGHDMIGKTNISAGTQLVITTFKPDLMINIGLAGNCTDSLKLGDAVVASSLTFHDFDPEIAAQFPPHTASYTPTERYAQLACGVLDAMGVKNIRGVVATGDRFISDRALKRSIIERTGCACVEMEGAAFACIAMKNGVDFVSVKIISDSAETDVDDEFSDTIDAGGYCDISTAFVRGMCEKLA